MPDYEIAKQDDGTHIASNGAVSLSVPSDGRIFKRRAIKRALSDKPEQVTWLVGEYRDVRIYAIDDELGGVHLVLTGEDLLP